MKYVITEDILRKIVEFAQKNPDAEFYTEPMNDGNGEFLSCNFYGKDKDLSISYIWELSEAKGDWDE